MLFCQYCGASLPNTSAVCGCRAKPKINDGGPAFPRPSTVWNLPDGRQTGTEDQTGMTLRDWFAGQALAGMASISLDDGDMVMGWADMAKAAYTAADAMLAERAKRGGR